MSTIAKQLETLTPKEIEFLHTIVTKHYTQVKKYYELYNAMENLFKIVDIKMPEITENVTNLNQMEEFIKSDKVLIDKLQQLLDLIKE